MLRLFIALDIVLYFLFYCMCASMAVYCVLFVPILKLVSMVKLSNLKTLNVYSV